MGWIGWKRSVLHCHLQAAGKYVHNLAHTRRRLRLSETTCLGLHRAMGQRPERIPAELRLDVKYDYSSGSLS